MEVNKPQNEIICRNCSSALMGEYCSHCGQKKFDRRDFTFGQFIKEFVDDLFDYDAKIFKTLKLLITQPGKLTNEYITGKQKAYVSPVKLYLVIITINFLVYSFFENYSLIEVSYLLELGKAGWAKSMLQNKLASSGLDETTFYHELNAQVNNTFSIALYFQIFFFALLLKLYYFKQNKFYIEHLIFCLYFMSFGFLRDTLFLPLNIYSKDFAVTISIVTTLIYFYLAIKAVYGNSGVARVVNAFVLYGLFLGLFSLCIIASVVVNLLT